jgi:glycosyltransferase involved in cell wall biosynthesis
MATADGICEAQKLTVFGQGSINGVDGIGGFCPAKHDRPQRRQLLGLGEGYLVIGFVGRLARDKGISELLSAWLTIREEFPNAYLAIAGSADERDPAPSEAIARLRADDRVRLLGWRKNTIDVYASLDIIVLPTYREGLPTVILEAAAMLVPAVASRCVGCVDAVVDGVTGLLVPPGDPVALADAIRTYLGNPDLRHQHGVNARARVLTDFRPEDVWEATLRTYQAAVSPPLPSPISARPGVNR